MAKRNENTKPQTTDSELITALLSCGGVKGAANSLGITTNAVYKRLQDNEFREQLETATAGVVANSAVELTLTLSTGISTLKDIAADKMVNPQTRMLAADKLLTHCARFLDLVHTARRREIHERECDAFDILGDSF